ncbi:MAG: arsenate reductase ArsC [Candidatus Deferrimicrobiaceae bacterium]
MLLGRRSILAEAILTRLGEGRFRAYSAGSHPKGEVHPLTVDLLRDLGYTTREVRSKSWDEFSKPGAPEMDFVITVCDDAAGDACPFWPGRPVKAHWGVPDPVATEGDEETRREAFQAVYRRLEVRLRRFLEPARAPTSRRKSATLGARQPEAVPQRPIA